MKKLLFILLVSLGLTFGANAQSKPYLQLGVSTGTSKTVNETAELGLQSDKNRVAVVANSYDGNNIKRQFLVGVKYTRVTGLVKGINGTASLAGRINTRNSSSYVVEPGLGVEANLFKSVGFVTGITGPLSQTNGEKSKFGLGGNVGLRFTL